MPQHVPFLYIAILGAPSNPITHSHLATNLEKRMEGKTEFWRYPSSISPSVAKCWRKRSLQIRWNRPWLYMTHT